MTKAIAETKETPALEIISKVESLVNSDRNSTYSTSSSFKSEKTVLFLLVSKFGEFMVNLNN